MTEPKHPRLAIDPNGWPPSCRRLNLSRRNLIRRSWLVACGWLLLLLPPLAAGESGQEPKDTPKVVRVVIDFGDGVEKRFTRLPWKPNMQVLDAMQAAHNHTRGIEFKHRGRGETAFLTEIDGLKNQGAGGGNWIFRVNGELAEKSFGITELKPDDTVLWSFGTYP